MSAEYTEFVTDFPINSLRIARDLVTGKNPGARSVGLAALSIESYALGSFLPTGTVNELRATVAAMPNPTKEQSLEAINRLDPASGMKTDPAQTKIDWLTLLRTLLPILISLL